MLELWLNVSKKKFIILRYFHGGEIIVQTLQCHTRNT